MEYSILRLGRGFFEGGIADICPTISVSSWQFNNYLVEEPTDRLKLTLDGLTEIPAEPMFLSTYQRLISPIVGTLRADASTTDFYIIEPDEIYSE